MSIESQTNIDVDSQKVVNPWVKHIQTHSAFHLSISNDQLDMLANSRKMSSKEWFFLFLGTILGSALGFYQSAINLREHRNLKDTEFELMIITIVLFSVCMTALVICGYSYWKDRKKPDELVEKIRTQTNPTMVVSLPDVQEYFSMTQK